jgi:hypothetical protein
MEKSAYPHSLALASTLLLFLGACGLARRLDDADRTAFAGIVTYGFACVAVMIAAAVSGFIVPRIVLRMAHDVASNAQPWQMVIHGIFEINQAFAQIYSVAASIAMILWSVSGLRNGALGRGVAIYGCIIAPLIIVGIAVGHLRLDVHGMAAVVLGQGIWQIVVGYQLSRSQEIGTEPATPRG